MTRAFLFLAGLVLAAAPLAAQVRPTPGAADPRIQTVDYAPDQVVVLEGAAGYQITVELSPDEQVENVAVGDSSAWQVSANRKGDHLFVKAIAAGVSTNMTVITNVRLYNFELTPAGSGNTAYTVRFRYPRTEPAADEDPGESQGEGRYRLSGDKALRPSQISDDGTYTYIRWPKERSLPAAYAVDDQGQEMIINGMMREDDVFVIDSVWRKLVFRIDKRVAGATRIRERK